MTDNLAVPLFPSSDRVPEAHRIGATVEQREYLCNGRIRTWTGAQQDVFSPVCEPVDGTARPKRIGSYPLLGAEQEMRHWVVVLVLTAVGWALAAVAMRQYRARVPYWV